MDLGSADRGVRFPAAAISGAAWASCLHTCASVSKQHKLVLVTSWVGNCRLVSHRPCVTDTG